MCTNRWLKVRQSCGSKLQLTAKDATTVALTTGDKCVVSWPGLICPILARHSPAWPGPGLGWSGLWLWLMLSAGGIFHDTFQILSQRKQSGSSALELSFCAVAGHVENFV
ncbi:hypothetical protein AWZ03_001371 [Drosophila navojoa]|uniref:Uncharacterized protein n=1 Tax=Drosophila navojoa TaxID=7232 RepID=A0A484BVH6_DRONA|nr:hypothetical protein AWZ03_001371 [Drosophila navojoa]